MGVKAILGGEAWDRQAGVSKRSMPSRARRKTKERLEDVEEQAREPSKLKEELEREREKEQAEEDPKVRLKQPRKATPPSTFPAPPSPAGMLPKDPVSEVARPSKGHRRIR